MTSQLHSRNNITSKETSVLTVPTQEMFKSRSFVVQSKQDKVQQLNLKKSLMQAENYGHHLNQIHPASTLHTTTATQSKSKSENTKPEVIQMTRKRAASSVGTGATKPPKKKRTTTIREDEAAKNKLGHVPGTFLPPEKPKDYVGTYEGQREKFKKTPSGKDVEADHMTPDSLHQPLGQKRKTSDGTALSKRLPAAQLPYELHRRKNTTGSGEEVEHQRAYLLHAHHGLVPFAGPMDTPKDHYAAAMEIDLRNTFDDRTVFGKPNSLDPRTFPPSHKQGMAIPFEDMAWSADRIKEMIHESNRQERISSGGKTHLNSVVEELLGALKGRYPKPK